MSRLKIMILVDTYYPLQDGVQTVTQYIAEGLAKNHDVLVITSLRDGMEKSCEYHSVRIERIRAKRNPYTLHMVGERKAMQERVRSFCPDALIVVGIQNWGYDWLKKRLDRYPGKKILYTHGASCLEDYSVWKRLRMFRPRRQILADLLKIYAEGYWKHYKEKLPKYMGRFDKVTYLYEKDDLYLYMKPYGLKNGMILENAVEDIFFERKAYLVNERKPLVFINVSSYAERKNQKLILKAFYDAKIPESRLVLIGSRETPYYRELKEYYEKLKEEGISLNRQIQILCGLERKKILEIYREADVYIAASEWEAMSISLCEAAAAGMPILTTDTGHASSIPGVFLCNTEEDFIEKMRLLYQDPMIRASRGKMAYEYAVLNYTIQNKVDRLEKVLIELTDEDGAELV